MVRYSNLAMVLDLTVHSVVFALAKLKWVHRDLSCTNIFCYRGSVKLGDLDFAEKFDKVTEDRKHGEFRTVVFLVLKNDLFMVANGSIGN